MYASQHGTSTTSAGVNIAVEANYEWQIQEIAFDGTEKYLKFTILLIKFAKLTILVDLVEKEILIAKNLSIFQISLYSLEFVYLFFTALIALKCLFRGLHRISTTLRSWRGRSIGVD